MTNYPTQTDSGKGTNMLFLVLNESAVGQTFETNINKGWVFRWNHEDAKTPASTVQTG